MLYNLSNPLDAQNARTRLEMLIKRGANAELTEKKPKRSLSQNSYLHLLLGYFASQTYLQPRHLRRREVRHNTEKVSEVRQKLRRPHDG